MLTQRNVPLFLSIIIAKEIFVSVTQRPLIVFLLLRDKNTIIVGGSHIKYLRSHVLNSTANL